MKFDSKKHVDLEQFVPSIIDNLNSFAKKESINKVYEVSIKDNYVEGTVSIGKTKKRKGNNFKTLIFTVTDLESRERLTLFSIDYKFKNPADKLTSNYKKALYKEFLSNVLLAFSFNFENIIRAERAEQILQRTVPTADKEDQDVAKSVIGG